MVQHISIRVPWHDHGWDGTVCQNPDLNNACLRLKNIYENRDDALECSLCGQCMENHEEELPCISEGGAFMSNVDLHKMTIHPYKQSNPQTHGHFLPTEITYPAYSLPARPFAWMMRDNIQALSETYGINYDESREPELNFKTSWIQECQNHKEIFKTFYHDVIPDQSLCIAYAKQVPFVEDSKRVIIGIGYVKRIVPAVEHNHTDEGTLRSMTWETQICHSIRADHENGFIIPYQAMMEYAETHPDFDINSVVVFAPEDAFEEFSYATEHVSYDAVIDVILSCIKSFEIINQCLDEDYSNVLTWLNERLSETWEERGAFPGLGAMLSAFGIPLGVLIAKEISDKARKGKDIWGIVDLMFEQSEKVLSSDLAGEISPIIQKTWKGLSKERKDLFKLLSRLSLTIDQAKILFYENEREKNRIKCSDKEILNNPYILYEQTRLMQEDYVISIKKVDRAVFPVPSIQEKYPLSDPTALKSSNDERRIRAIAIAVLEQAAESGSTILPCNLLIDKVKELNLDPDCPVTSDILKAISKFMEPEIINREMKDGTEYYKLVRFQEFDDVIENRIKKRFGASNIPISADWRKMIDDKFGESDSEIENRARTEKAAILDELAKSHISVLIGDAGTGKTTVLSILCSQEDIRAGGVLLLAPTGKATVRLMESMGEVGKEFTALNVAQFLVKSNRFDWNDKRYILSDSAYSDVPETVIIDEASMLTEEMFGALLQAIRQAKRIIFVGDPNQLPPIGAGRPFVDLTYMLKENLKSGFPKVCAHYGELTINRRQQSDIPRLDVELSHAFTNTESKLDEDLISEIAKGESETIQIVKWTTKEELENKLLQLIANETVMSSVDDQTGFDLSLGATVSGQYLYFNKGAAAKADAWQILAPVHNMPHGVMNINRLIHLKYRQNYMDLSKRWGRDKRIAKMLGPEGIVYGDKVINVVNTSKKKAFPDDGKARNYIANGEIGIACGGFSSKRRNDNMSVEFSTQPGYLYYFNKSDFNDEEGSANIELAYALTVHKAQGSQFGTVILVLSEPCSIISREMLYTALTRQVDKIIILYNQEPYHLLNYASPENSDIAKRFTDLFADKFTDENHDYRPQIVSVNGSFYEDKLIHKTARGDLVRSKSEVIIANALYHHGLDYEYEPDLVLEGHLKRPDFKIIDYDTGDCWYWEHCGMMTDPQYKKHWEEKKKFYEKNGIKEGVNLIVTYDDANGGLDSSLIESIINETFDE